MRLNLCFCTATTLLKQNINLSLTKDLSLQKNDDVSGLAKNYFQIKPQED